MNLNLRRLVLLTAGVWVLLFFVLIILQPWPNEIDRELASVNAELRPQQPASADERLSKYRGGNNFVSLPQRTQHIFDDSIGYDNLVYPSAFDERLLFDSRQRKAMLMSETAFGSMNEQSRQIYVHLPEWSNNQLETLWWSLSDGGPNDRILAQLRHVPLTSGQNPDKLKTIYLPGGLDNNPGEQEKFIEEQCPVNACRLSADPKDADTAESRMFRENTFFKNDYKPAGQIWIVLLLESPTHTADYIYAKNLINWTATYRWDSTFVTPYDKFVPYHNADDPKESLRMLDLDQWSPTSASRLNTTRRNYAAGKTKMVAWFVSNCWPENKRDEYAKELAQYVNVDVYGHCGTMSCPASEPDQCRDMLNRDYKFYLSFENTNCDYYITEKFFGNGLKNDVVPIVMGARKEDYKRAAPPHSYIHVEDFSSAKDLAMYLHRLDQSDELYNEYFAWKGTGEFINTKFWCRLCAMLHYPDKPPMWYTDFDRWWAQSGTCRRDRWHNGTFQ